MRHINLKFSFQSLLFLIDSFIIFLNISNSYSAIPYLLFFQYSRVINTIIISLINVIYIIFRFKNKVVFPTHILFLIYIVINLTNILSGLLTNTFQLTWVTYLFANTLFYIILYNLFKRYLFIFTFSKTISLIFRGYFWLVAINIIGVLSLFLLIKIFGFYPLINNIGNKMDLFLDNIQRTYGQIQYYLPLNISIISTDSIIKIPFFKDYGAITGFYHEPHIITFMLTPALFLLIAKYERFFTKASIIVMFTLIILIAASTTNLLALLICIIVYLINKFRTSIVIPLLIISLFVFIFSLIDENTYAFLFAKLKSSSKDYSIGTIMYAFSPKTLLGTNFYDLSYIKNNNNGYDVGFINFALNLIFLTILSFKIVSLSMSKTVYYRAIGFFSLYFLIHSAKVAMVSYSLSFLTLVIFMVSIHYDDKINNSNLSPETNKLTSS